MKYRYWLQLPQFQIHSETNRSMYLVMSGKHAVFKSDFESIFLLHSRKGHFNCVTRFWHKTCKWGELYFLLKMWNMCELGSN